MSCAIDKLGSEEVRKMQKQYKKINESEQDGMITTLIVAGLSQIEIKSMFDVGGYRTSRLQKMSKLSEEELQMSHDSVLPSHACTDDDREAVKRSVGSFDVKLSYPCAH